MSRAEGHTLRKGCPRTGAQGGHCAARALPPSGQPSQQPLQSRPGRACLPPGRVRAGVSYSGSVDPASNHSKCTEKVLPSPSASGLARGLPRSKCRGAARPPHPSHLLAPRRPRAQARPEPGCCFAPCVLSRRQGKWPGAPFKAVTQSSLLR